MSECVVRMEVPENCYECDIYMSLFVSDCPIYQKDGGQGQKHKYTRSRHPDCPILAVLPEKHGRLGELDELERKVNAARIRVMQSGGDTNPYWECVDLCLQTPTIVPATEGGEAKKSLWRYAGRWRRIRDLR